MTNLDLSTEYELANTPIAIVLLIVIMVIQCHVPVN
jgi:hypothetical protein